jgi:acyl-coenzyme A synthetase/AMP-(fatty) acid ligase
VLNNVRKLIGIHRSRMLITGAAPISPDLVRWYMALGVPMLEVWGMTETGGGTGMPIERIKPGIHRRAGASTRSGCRPRARSWCAAATCSWAT